jgi:hypothetical protein
MVKEALARTDRLSSGRVVPPLSKKVRAPSAAHPEFPHGQFSIREG